jgi:cell division protease FtsH
MADLEEAKDKVMMGKERRSVILSEDEKKTTAYHEGGHALVANLLPKADPVHKVSIIPRGQALGVTMQLPLDDRHNYSKEYLESTLAVMMGGRVAELLFLHQMTTGASNDLERASKVARKMVCEWGMSDTFGSIALSDNGNEVFLGRELVQHKQYSEETARLIDAEVRKILQDAYNKAKRLLEENADVVHRLAAALLERETISGSDLTKIMNNEELPPYEPPADRKNGQQLSGQDSEGEEEDGNETGESSIRAQNDEQAGDDESEFSFKDDEDPDEERDRDGK